MPITTETVLERLYAAAHLVNSATGLDCVIVSPETKIMLELPPNHLERCFCKRLESITGTKNNIDHFFNRCEEAQENTTYIIYSCPFGLTNVIIPGINDNRMVAALQIGPITTCDTDELLQKYGLSIRSADVKNLQEIKEYLDTLPKASISYIITMSELVNALVTDESITFRSEQMPINDYLPDYTPNACEDVIGAVQEFVASHFTDNDISLDSVAKNVYVHPSYLSRIFSQQFNCHFRSYINTLRINMASELLAETDKTVGEICQEVGFSDHSYFNKVFRQLKGVTPSEYRNACHGQGGNTADPAGKMHTAE